MLAGIIIRLYFHIGHIFSDDAYYSFLGHALLVNSFPGNYLGYPVFPLRINEIFLYALSFKIFGINEFATEVFPFIFSILNILLTYILAKALTKDEITSLLASFLISFFPTDIVFATIGFPDLINVFFINLGILCLVKAYETKKILLSIISGICFFASMQFKENTYYFLIMLSIIWIYLLVNKKPHHYLVAIPIILICSNILLEGIFYLIKEGQFFYRLEITESNYRYSYYDFFPHTAFQAIGNGKSIWLALIYQVFIINLRSIFLRRFYLFLPLIALIWSYIALRKKKYNLLCFWFLGLVILFAGFTTSFSQYKPLDLHRSWYIYPMLMPVIIFSAMFIAGLKNYLKYIVVGLYIFFSIVMCKGYEVYFGKENGNKFKNFIKGNRDKVIYTDPFTKYSIDLLRNYKDETDSKRILGKDFDLLQIPNGAWIVFNQKHLDELKLQKHNFPKFTLLNSKHFKLLGSFEDFKIYEKVF